MNTQNKPKIIRKRSYKYWGLLASFINALVPILYITFMYDIFKNSGIKGTYWLWIIIIIILNFAKRFILDFIANFNETYSKTQKRISYILTIVIVAIVLIASTYFLKDLVMLLFALAGGMLASLYPYHKYHTNKDKYDRLKKVQTKLNDEDDIKSGKIKLI